MAGQPFELEQLGIDLDDASDDERAFAAAKIREVVEYFDKPKDAPGRSLNASLLEAADQLDPPAQP